MVTDVPNIASIDPLGKRDTVVYDADKGMTPVDEPNTVRNFDFRDAGPGGGRRFLENPTRPREPKGNPRRDRGFPAHLGAARRAVSRSAPPPLQARLFLFRAPLRRRLPGALALPLAFAEYRQHLFQRRRARGDQRQQRKQVFARPRTAVQVGQ